MNKSAILYSWVIAVACQLLALTASAQAFPGGTPMSESTGVSPYYFGPNAFAVPDLVYRTCSTLRVELKCDYFYGHRHDNAGDLALKVDIPLFTRRANLSVWLPVKELYYNSDENMDACHVDPLNREKARNGFITGDVYVAATVQLLEEKKHTPDLTIRAAIKTASGGGYNSRRYYDSPGYFFDTGVSKSWQIYAPHALRFRFAATSGFLCWQTANGRQNDAVMYGAMAGLENPHFRAQATLGGYAGWEGLSCNNKKLAHDRPMTLKANATWLLKHWELFAGYEQGIYDYPYTRWTLGAAYCINILNRHKPKAKF